MLKFFSLNKKPSALSCFLVLLVALGTLPQTSQADTRVVMLGTGTPVPFPERSGPSVAIIVDQNLYIFDFGPGLVRRATALTPRFGGDIAELDPKNMTIAFLTHLHHDHSSGFADMLLTGWSGGHRNQPMEIYGPEGVEELIEGTLAAFDHDIKYRVYGLEDTNDMGWRVNVHTVKEGLVFSDEKVKVFAFPVLHGSWPNAFGYRVVSKDKTIVISGDLRPNEKIREYSKNADYLIHETYCHRGLIENMSPVRQAYHRSNHTSSKELAQLANEVRPGTLVLTHILPFGCSFEDVLEEVQADYDGKVILAEDLDIYD